MKKIFTCIILSMCFLLFGCTSYSKDRVEYILYNQVPFAAVSPQRRFHNYEEIEKDSYGRILIFCEIPGTSYVMNDFFENADGKIFVYLIFQKVDYEDVWIYDNDCYLFVTSKDASNSELEKFKIANDWEQSLNEEKMHQYDSSHPTSQYQNDEEYRSFWKSNQYMKIGDESFTKNDIFVSYLKTSNNRSFFIARHKKQVEPTCVYGKTYLFTIEEGEIRNVKEITGTPLEWKEQIRDYKNFLDGK